MTAAKRLAAQRRAFLKKKLITLTIKGRRHAHLSAKEVGKWIRQINSAFLRTDAPKKRTPAR